MPRRFVTRTRFAALTLAAATAGASLAAGTAQAAPDQGNYVTTIRCNTADPFGGGSIRTGVAVYNQIPHPSDGLPGPAIELIATGARTGGVVPNLQIYSINTAVSWHNVDNGRRGTVRVPTRTNRVTWQVVLHPGPGRVNFTIKQKVGAVIGVPMVNPQTSVCRGSATA